MKRAGTLKYDDGNANNVNVCSYNEHHGESVKAILSKNKLISL